MDTSLAPFRRLLQPFPDDDFDRTFRRFGRMLERETQQLDMRSDVREEDNRYVVDVDLPGVRKEDIDVAVAGNAVTVQARFGTREGEAGGKRLQQERMTGECFRSFTFPSEIDAAHASADFEHGVLTLSLPKTDGARAQHLRIN